MRRTITSPASLANPCDGIDLDLDAISQHRLHGGAGWTNSAEKLRIHLVEAAEIPDIGEMARTLQHVVETASRRLQDLSDILHRSEERRVGKECRSRWSPY